MHRAVITALAAAALGGAGLAAAADPTELMPRPLQGWTAAGPVYGESLIETPEGGEKRPVPPKRIELSRDYSRDGETLRISLNTHDRRGVQLIAWVNETADKDPEAAAELAGKGIRPFSFGSRQGVTMKAGGEGKVSGAAIRLGEQGTLTLEGIHEGKPATVALDHVTAYLEHADLERMAAFIREANESQAVPQKAE